MHTIICQRCLATIRLNVLGIGERYAVETTEHCRPCREALGPERLARVLAEMKQEARR